jgi:hypothetical protein
MTNQTRTHKVISLLIKLAAAITLVVLIVGVSVFTYWVSAHGDIAEAFRLQPTIDGSTPRTQGPFSLVDIERTDYDGAINLATSPRITIPLNTKMSQESACLSDIGDWDCLIRADGLPPVKSLHVRAVAALPVHVTITRSDNKEEPFAVDRDALSHADFPAGVLPIRMSPVTPGCRYVDIRITDSSGKSARWRVVDAPHYRPIALTPNAKDEHIVVDGAAIELAKSVKRHKDMQVIETRLAFTPPPSKTYIYRLRLYPEDFNIEQYPLSKYWPLTSAPKLTGNMYEETEAIKGTEFNDDFLPIDLSQINAVRITGAVVTEMCRDESVTFHNLPNLLQATGRTSQPSLTTPSGVVAKLVSDRALNSTNLEFSSPATSSFFSKGSKKQTVSYELLLNGKAPAADYSPLSGPGDGSISNCIVPLPPSDTRGRPLKNFTVLIRHIIDIHESRFSVTVPLNQSKSFDKAVSTANCGCNQF